ncbi:DoxX family membrane protein [bacterium]|nr:DoxX family membrane protein [candidate division CSSED10-310 bacterium]
MNKLRLLEWVCRWIAGGTFIFAAMSKIMVPCELSMDVYHYQMAPGFMINIVAIVLPAVELVLGTALITGFAPRGAALGISVILFFFIIMLTINIIRGVDFECGCFGNPETDICQKIANFFKFDHPDMDRITFVRIRTACDVVRDILLLVAAWASLSLLNRRLRGNDHGRRFYKSLISPRE